MRRADLFLSIPCYFSQVVGQSEPLCLNSVCLLLQLWIDNKIMICQLILPFSVQWTFLPNVVWTYTSLIPREKVSVLGLCPMRKYGSNTGSASAKRWGDLAFSFPGVKIMDDYIATGYIHRSFESKRSIALSVYNNAVFVHWQVVFDFYSSSVLDFYSCLTHLFIKKGTTLPSTEIGGFQSQIWATGWNFL